jgi:predicted RNase H-like HicB family nuclease
VESAIISLFDYEGCCQEALKPQGETWETVMENIQEVYRLLQEVVFSSLNGIQHQSPKSRPFTEKTYTSSTRNKLGKKLMPTDAQFAI